MKEFNHFTTRVISDNPNLKISLMKNFKFDVYLQQSIPTAYQFPHIGYELKEDIMINYEKIKQGTILFYHFNGFVLTLLDK